MQVIKLLCPPPMFRTQEEWDTLVSSCSNCVLCSAVGQCVSEGVAADSFTVAVLLCLVCCAVCCVCV